MWSQTVTPTNREVTVEVPEAAGTSCTNARRFLDSNVLGDSRSRKNRMNEIHFIVAEAPDGGFVARALGADIFTQADDLDALHVLVRDAVDCHFDEGERPGVICVHIGREEVRMA
jgi:hypothetical protein